jgi:rubrerythrin
MDLRRIYEYALSREYEGKHFFEENASRLKHAAAVQAFKQLAEEEQKHIDYIHAQIAALDKDGDLAEPVMYEMEDAGYFTTRALSEGIDQSVAEAMVPDLPVLRMAYLIERDFAEFYAQAAEKTGGHAKEVFQRLANWERGHERLFKQYHDRAFELYAKMPWGG